MAHPKNHTASVLTITVCALLFFSSCKPPPKPAPRATPTPVPTPLPTATPTTIPPPAFSWIHTDEAKFVNEEGQTMRFRGCNLGNWFLLEMWMLQIFDILDQYRFEQILTDRFGPEQKNRLMEIYRENWITQRDFEIIQSCNFNVVRLPFSYELLEDDANPFVLKPDGLAWLDKAVDLAMRHGLYVILDLHGIQGRQSTDHTTGYRGINRLYTDPDAQRRATWLWTELARHYRDNPAILAYDLINEPFGDMQTNQHEQELIEIIDQLYQAVRSVDKKHIILIPGTHSGVEFYGDPRDKGWQQVGFTEHFYPGLFGQEPTLKTHARFLQHKLPWRAEYFRQLNTPFLVGEFNAVFDDIGGGMLTRYYFDTYNDYGWAATMWSYKLLRSPGGNNMDDSWSIVWNRDPIPDIDIRQSSREAIESFFRWFGTMQYSRNEKLFQSMQFTRKPMIEFLESPPLITAPAAEDPLPAGWTAAEIGPQLPGGQKVESDTAMTLYSAGKDIWETDDNFRFVCTPVDGDFSFSATLNTLQRSKKWAKAGLMLRTGATTDAPHVLLATFADGFVMLGWREKPGAKMQQLDMGSFIFPLHMKLERKDEFLYASCSSDGHNWTTKKLKLSKHFGRKAAAGMALTSNDRHYFSAAEFSEINVQR